MISFLLLRGDIFEDNMFVLYKHMHEHPYEERDERLAMWEGESGVLNVKRDYVLARLQLHLMEEAHSGKPQVHLRDDADCGDLEETLCHLCHVCTKKGDPSYIYFGNIKETGSLDVEVKCSGLCGRSLLDDRYQEALLDVYPPMLGTYCRKYKREGLAR